jgi:hypothetical protein
MFLQEQSAEKLNSGGLWHKRENCTYILMVERPKAVKILILCTRHTHLLDKAAVKGRIQYKVRHSLAVKRTPTEGREESCEGRNTTQRSDTHFL